MGQIDIMTHKYMSDNGRFADAFNYLLFGEQVVIPKKLQERDITELGIVFNNTNNVDMSVQKYRDILKEACLKTDGSYYYLLLGVENQAKVHTAMPVRNLLYDAFNYEKQVSKKSRENKKNKRYTCPEEFLSGFLRTDKLVPVITLAIYWGSGEWDAPRRLHEMFDVPDKRILKYVNDYDIHLIVPREINDFDRFSTELGLLMKFISKSEEKEKILQLQNDERYKDVSSEGVILLNKCTGSRIPAVKNEKGGIDVCKGIDDLRKEAFDNGERKGELNGVIKSIENLAENVGDLERACLLLNTTLEKYRLMKAQC